MIKERNFRKYRLMLLGMLVFLGMMMTPGTIRVSAGSIVPVPATLTTDTYDMDGDGVMDEVYEISTSAQLYWFAGLVNGTLEGTEQNNSANAVLKMNITVNRSVLGNDKNIADDTDTGDFVSWMPIGTKETPYQGRFDGLGHTVRGLYYNNKSDYVGFFGFLGVPESGGATASDAMISNVLVRDSYFSAGQYVGGLCGYNNYGSISRSSFDGTVMGDGDVGGLCGRHTGTLSLSYNKGNVVNLGTHTGGLCGSMERGGRYAITNCYNTGNVRGTTDVGGICGWADSDTGGWWCYSSGTYTGTDPATVQGLCGFNSGVKNSCYLGEGSSYSAEAFADGTVAYQLTFSLQSPFGAGLGVWGQTIGVDPAPVLFGETVYKGKDTEGNDVYHNHLGKDLNENGVCTYCNQYVAKPDQINGVYQISNAQELDWFSWYVSVGNTSVDAVLTKNITYNDNLLAKVQRGDDINNTWTPIGKYLKPYQGTFDGRNHTISGLYVNNTDNGPTADYKGLFGDIDGRAEIKNVIVSDSYMYGRSNIGLICGASGGKIENCHSSGIVAGLYYAGGICGNNSGGTIRNCSNKADVTAHVNLFSYTKGYYAGGVTGANSGSISFCSNSGTVTAKQRYAGGISGIENDGGSITCCYNRGTISAESYAGGISGGYRVTISDSFNAGSVSASSEVGAIYCYPSSNPSPLTNCYYLENCCYKNSNLIQDQSGAEGKSLEKFKSGEVTYLLNQNDDSDTPVWFQNLDNGFGRDAYPSFTGGTVYYDETADKYSNKRGSGSPEFEYSAVGAVITETCTAIDHTATATLKMDPDKNTIYTGAQIEPVMVEYSSDWQGGSLTITYENNTDISENGATASISKGNATATISFGIQKHELIYATNGESITENCYYCKHKETATLTMDPDADLSYTGSPISPVTVVYSDGWLGNELPVTYENNTCVTEQGATAHISKGDTTATLTFMITKADRKAPVVTAVPETIRGKGDGKLEGLTTDMEWSTNNSYYNLVTDVNMNFAPGSYYIRYQENENQTLSEPTYVTFEEGTALLSVTMQGIPSAFSLTADKTGLAWKDTVTLTLSGPLNDCDYTVKINDEAVSPDSGETNENTRNYTVSEVTQNLIITLVIVDGRAPDVYFLSGSKEPLLTFYDYQGENQETTLFYKNRTEFLFRIEDRVSGVESAEYLLSEQSFEEEYDVAGQWKQLSPEEDGLYRISCPPGTKGYSYFRVTDKNGNQQIVNTPELVVYEDAVLNTEQITYLLTSGADQPVSVDFNGNTVKAVYLGDILIDPANYSVSGNGVITLKKSWLETLTAKEDPYQLKVEYNPLGVIYQELGLEIIDWLGIEYINVAPKVTTLNLTVKNPSYTIVAEAGANGNISPSGTITVEKGAGKSFTFTPDQGYVIDTVTVDGKTVEAVSGYTFSDVTGNHTISVTFKEENRTEDTEPSTEETEDTEPSTGETGDTEPSTGETGNTEPAAGETGDTEPSTGQNPDPEAAISSSQIKKNSIKLDTEASVVWKNNRFTVTWGRVSGASGYEIYAVQYGKTLNSKSLVKTVERQTGSTSFTKIGGKKPVSGKVYKLKVKAYKLIDDEKVYIGSSSTYCVVRNNNTKYTNASRVTVKKKTVKLKKGKTSQIEASVTKQSKSKKLLGKPYGSSLRYYSANTSVATVTSKGKIKAKKKGSCYIYVTALNGKHTRVKVTVK